MKSFPTAEEGCGIFVYIHISSLLGLELAHPYLWPCICLVSPEVVTEPSTPGDNKACLDKLCKLFLMRGGSIQLISPPVAA